MITLRPYQQQAVDAILADWDAGYADLLLTMATGGGKTAVFLTVLDQVLTTDGCRGLVLAHRKELIDQPLARLFSYYPHWQGRAGVVMADQHEPDRQLIVATVQSLSASPRRLNDILSHGLISYLVTDEAHHATADSYMAVYDRLRLDNPDMLHLGVTATPIRADGDGLRKVFQKESAHYGIVELIQAGYLAPVRWLAIQTAISLKGVQSRGGDFVARQLADVYELDNCFDLVVESHRKYADGRQAVAFTVTVEGAHRLAEKFNQAGITASAADGTTEKRTRARILADFTAGRTAVLCNVGLYTEGLDVPQASCIHQVRPTRSDGLYTQMVGRALRTYPGKEDALILDYAPIETRNIAMMGDVLGCPLRKDAYIEQDAEQGDVQAAFTFDGKFGWREGSATEIVARQLDYLDISPWCWHRDQAGFMSIGLGEAADEVERTLVITPPDVDGQLILYGVWRRNGGSWQAREIGRGNVETLLERAEDLSNKWGNAALAAKTRRWRKEPPTDRQIKFARRIKGAWKPGMTKGQVAQSITHALAIQAVQHGVSL